MDENDLGSLEAIFVAMKQSPDGPWRCNDGPSLLVMKGSNETLLHRILNQAHPNLGMQTSLHLAAAEGHLSIVMKLLEKGV